MTLKLRTLEHIKEEKYSEIAILTKVVEVNKCFLMGNRKVFRDANNKILDLLNEISIINKRISSELLYDK